MQNDIDIIVKRTNTWLMKLNIDKCKIMHIGKKNNRNNYTMKSYIKNERTQLIKSQVEKDLGVLISYDIKSSAQANQAASNANKKLGMLKRTFRSRGADTWKKLYTTYVRPLLEFTIPVWNPYKKSDINILERIQHRAKR